MECFGHSTPMEYLGKSIKTLSLFYRRRSKNRIHEMVQASGLVLDFGGSGVFRSGAEHDWRLAQGSVQENKRRGMICQT